MTVAADGSGDAKTVQQAIDAAPDLKPGAPARVVIHVKPGRYHEKLTVPRGKVPVTLAGDDAAATVLTYGDKYDTLDANGDKIGTFRSASTTVLADDFSAEGLTFENSAGPVGQALSISVRGDRAAFRRCRFLGWQDTVFLDRGRQYFADCFIAGHVDYIFGGATAFFDGCEIRSLGAGFLTAPSTPEGQKYGFVFRDCKLTADAGDFQAYLGRPWRPFGAAAFINTEMAAHIRPAGWDSWSSADNERTARFAEYGSTGPGAAPEKRVAWAMRLTEAEAAEYTPANVMAGDDHWDPKTGTHDAPAAASPSTRPADKGGTAYLFTSFRDPANDALHLAWSEDGYRWAALVPPAGRTFLTPTVGPERLIRDPSICLSPDGTFHMLWTAGWKGTGLGYAHSKDLLHWSDQKYVDVMGHEPTTLNVWAPEVRYEESRRQFVVYWSSTIPGRFPGDDDHPEKRNHRIYYTTTRDFDTFAKPKVLFDPGHSVIDAIILDRPDTRFALVYKDERRPMRRLRVAFCPQLWGPFENSTEPFTEPFTEGPTALRIGDKWVVYYDSYRDKKYGATESTDLRHWTDVSDKVSFPPGHKHGTAIEVPRSVIDNLRHAAEGSEGETGK